MGYSPWDLEESDRTEVTNAFTWCQDLCQLLEIGKDEKDLFSLCTQKIPFLMGKQLIIVGKMSASLKV